jgi:hypothetical protein
MALAHTQKQQNKKKKGGASLCQKLAMVPTKTKTKTKKKKSKFKNKNKIGCLPLSLCFQSLCSSSSKFSTLQALSSLNPNTQLVGNGVIARGMWGG